MKTEILPDAEAVARRGAVLIAEHAREAVRARGQCLLAFSGGSSPLRMFEHLVKQDIPWAQVHVFQVDERVVDASSEARNFKQLKKHLLDKVALQAAHIHAFDISPAVDQPSLNAVATRYAKALRELGAPLDVVHLGLGADGHTASLFEGDAATEVVDSEVAVTSVHAGFRRLTLTYPVLAAARNALWVVTGADKAEALGRLLAGDASIPAGRVSTAQATLLTEAVLMGR